MIPVWVILFALLATAFFSAAEMAFIAANRVRLRHLAEGGSRTAARYLEAFRQPERVLSTAMMGVTIAHVTASTVATWALIPLAGGAAAIIVTVALTPLMLVFGEVIPKAVAREWATALIRYLFWVIEGASRFLAPFTWAANTLVGRALRLFGRPPSSTRQFVSREELKLLLQMEPTEADVTQSEAEMIDKIFDLGETTVREVMVPLVDVAALPGTATPDDAVRLIQERGFSRIPIYTDRVLNMVGVVAAMDLLRRGAVAPDLASLMRPATYVPDTRRIDDLLREMQRARMQLAIVGEEIQEVDHCLLALEEVPLTRIRRVFSHPVALSQCGRFLSTLADCHVEAFTDTAMAARRVRDEQDLSQAAVASEEAARLYGLVVLKRGIADQRENYTRMAIVAQKPIACDLRVPCKTSLLFTTRHEQGALPRCLSVLADHHLSMTKLESRPRPRNPWEYLFHVDFEGNLADPDVAEALRELAGRTSYLKVLGSYPSRTAAEARPAEPRPRASLAAAPPQEQPAEPAALEKRPYTLAARTERSEDTVVTVAGVAVGGPRPVVIAGPCAVESREQVRACARIVKEMGGDLLRGGCFKPRTSPYSFQGLGYEALDMLAEAGAEAGLPIVTEVMHPADVGPVAEKAHVLQIGARNMQNFSLLKVAGRCGKPVLLKRGISATIVELLLSAEYLLAEGNHDVILCERGVRSFDTMTRNLFDLTAIPVVHKLSHLPIIADPSHGTGLRDKVIPMARAAVAAGADGIMVEVHPNPEEALSDGAQTLYPDQFTQLMREVRIIAEAIGRRVAEPAAVSA